MRVSTRATLLQSLPSSAPHSHTSHHTISLPPNQPMHPLHISLTRLRTHLVHTPMRTHWHAPSALERSHSRRTTHASSSHAHADPHLHISHKHQGDGCLLIQMSPGCLAPGEPATWPVNTARAIFALRNPTLSTHSRSFAVNCVSEHKNHALPNSVTFT